MMVTGKAAAGAIVSVSMAIVATQAMAAVAKDSKQIFSFGESEVDETLQSRMDAAVAKRDVRQAVAEAFEALASSFGEGDVSLSSKYFPDGIGMLAQTNPRSDDFVESVGGAVGCYSNCHSACHSACHGSRSWR